MADDLPALLTAFQQGQVRALARLISRVEDDPQAGARIMPELADRLGHAQVVGITGSPGAGKSTVVDSLVATMRERGQTVAVVAVDPSSPFNGGGLLGDRVRMRRHNADPGVFIRSMATRGALGGLSRATWQTVKLLDAYGFDWILVETVGVGQSEVDIARVADTTVLVLVPGMGDDIQALKAGVMEIGDIILINKADRDGIERTLSEVEMRLEQYQEAERPRPPVVLSVAKEGTGIGELLGRIEEHRDFMVASGLHRKRRRLRLREQVVSVVDDLVHRFLDQELNSDRAVELWQALETHRIDIYTVARELSHRMLTEDAWRSVQ